VSVFRPSATVRLQIRAEEFAQTAALRAGLPQPGAEAPPPAPTPQASTDTDAILASIQERRRQLEARRADLSPEDYAAQTQQLDEEQADVLASSTDWTMEGQPPAAVADPPPDDLTVVGQVQPVSLMIERNGLAQAGTATIEVAWADAPLDPRVIRAIHVVATLGVVPAADWEAGMRGERKPDDSLRSVVSSGDPGTTDFAGYADKEKMELSEADAVTLECRDMSAPLRDRELRDGECIDLTLPVDRGVAAFLDSLGPETRNMKVSYRGPEQGNIPVPAAGASQERGRRRGRVVTRGRGTGERCSAWDHVTDVVRGMGLLPVMDGFTLALIAPRTLYSTSGGTALAGGGGEPRRMVWGRNLRSLSFERVFCGVRAPTIEVRSYDPDQGRTIWARYPVAAGQPASGVLGRDVPPAPSRASAVQPSGSANDAIRVMVVQGVTDPGRLAAVARNAFEQIGRQEISGTFETDEVTSYDAPEDAADLLAMNAGDAVELLMAQADSTDAAQEAAGTASTMAEIQAMDRARRADYMVALGWPRAVAERFAALQDATGFQTVFRVQRVTLRFSEEGFSLSCDFINYVTVREDA
jgi:hypothetical protein